MVFREDPDGLILIAQPAHSWISGQLARHWGNAEFGGFAPVEEVCLAAELHDLGFLPWEKAPTLNPATGRPHDFLNMPTVPHLDLWAAGVLKLEAYSRYAALLVSLHLAHLCQHNKVDKSPRAAPAAQGFLDQQHAFQTELIEELRADRYYAPHATDAVIARNRQLVAAWDWMSLVCCRGLAGEWSVSDVPAQNGVATLRITTPAACAVRVSVAPWPFRVPVVQLVCDGRRLPQTFADETEMRAALREAPAVAVTICLSPV